MVVTEAECIIGRIPINFGAGVFWIESSQSPVPAEPEQAGARFTNIGDHWSLAQSQAMVKELAARLIPAAQLIRIGAPDVSGFVLIDAPNHQMLHAVGFGGVWNKMRDLLAIGRIMIEPSPGADPNIVAPIKHHGVYPAMRSRLQLHFTNLFGRSIHPVEPVPERKPKSPGSIFEERADAEVRAKRCFVGRAGHVDHKR